MAFDPDAYLAVAPAPAAKSSFNPDAYLAQDVSNIPQGRKAATLAEQALATPTARMALGAVSPLVGAVQFGANVGDYLVEKFGQKPVVGKAISDWWNNVQAMKERGMEATSPESALGVKPYDIAGTLGSAATAMLQPATGITKGAQIVQGLKQGAVAGAMQPGTEKLSTQLASGAAGGIVGGAAPLALPAVAKAAGWAYDAATGRLIQVKAGKVLREIAGDDLAAIQAATGVAKPGLTAGQAVQEAGITAPAFQAMGQRAPTPQTAAFIADKAAADKAARVAALEAQTPNLPNALAVRNLGSKATYGNAMAADEIRLANLAAQEQASRSLSSTAGPTFEAKLSPELQALKKNPAISAAEAEAKKLAATKGVDLGKDPMSTLQGLHYMKLAIDSQFKNPTASTALQNYSNAALQNTKTQLLGAIEQVSPQYGAARWLHAKLSEPVNQAQVLNELATVLKGSGSAAEKPTQFLNALGQGESAMLKRADLNPQFGGIKEVLTPEQKGAVTKVAGELKREAAMAELAFAGKEALAGILRERPTTVPGINMASAIANRVSSVLRGRVADSTMEALAKGMQSGKGANELLATLPASERNEVLKALGELKLSGGLAEFSGRGVTNMMTPNRKNQNALVQ